MRRAIVLSALVAVGSLSLSATAYLGQSGQEGPRTIEVEKVRDNLFVLRGGGGNTSVFVQSDGVTVVDTKNPGWGQPILAQINQLTNKPVTTIINTHTHGDHVSGNVEFPVAVEIVTHELTAANMKKMAGPSIFEQNDGRGLPERTFTDRMTLGSGADQIDLHYFGRGHTNGDAWVLFTALRVVHAGDILAWNDQVPFLDAANGGSGVELPDTLMKAHAALGKSADVIITGHRGVMDFDDLSRWADFNRGFLNEMRQAKQAGQSVEEAAKAWTPPAGFNPSQETRLLGNIQAIYSELP